VNKRVPAFIAIGAVVLAAIGAFVYYRASSLPRAGSPAYEQVTAAFYHGLAALEVGLLDDARQQFARATEVVPDEPAAWANLGLSQLRLGELDAAAEPIERAAMLAPENSDIALLAGRMESARGRLDEAIVHLRRAVALDDASLRARFALVDELDRAGTPDAETAIRQLLDELLARAPDNLAVLIERARSAARRGDAARLRDSVARLEPASRTWSALAVEQFRALESAAAAVQGGAGDATFVDAERRSNQLRNVLARVPAYGESLAAVRTPTELIAEPFVRFLLLEAPSAMPSPPDTSLAFSRAAVDGGTGAVAVAIALTGADAPEIFVADAVTVRRTAGAPGSWPFPGGAGGGAPGAHGLVPVDWNHDFLVDLVLAGPGGVRLLLQQESGTLVDATGQAEAGTAVACDCTGVWAADVDMEGDVDLVLGQRSAAPFVLRNNGDGTWRRIEPFAGIAGARAFAWADLDHDADPDAAFVDGNGVLAVFLNRQAGSFTRDDITRDDTASAPVDLASLAVADIDANGTIDLVTLGRDGAITRLSRDSEEWAVENLATGPNLARVFVADLDNNGALDLIGSGPAGTRVWLGDERNQFQAHGAAPAVDVGTIVDVNADGRLDLVGVSDGQAVRFLSSGEADYHWKAFRPRAQQQAGDQRINSQAIGGEIEIRSGLLTQKQVLTGGSAHFGLGSRSSLDVVRIVWPNGVAQAEFGIGVDDLIVAEQRLKGSCPWVFAWDGTAMGFVTDFIWRSPLGLRINAQDTAGVTQTEDWVRIPGAQLQARNGAYDVRITAELWETHFFDHVSLLVVDHPADTEVYVDERFNAARPPTLGVQAVKSVRAVAAARDHAGTDVTALVAAADGRHVATLARGRYQGIARDHFVEIDPGTLPLRPVLLARGWIYPTDSSINMAIAQGAHAAPKGVALEMQDASGRWSVVEADLGFPAGKNKTMVIDLQRARDAVRLRLRTNLEVYWDALAIGEGVDAPVQSVRLPAGIADLAFRGYSQTTSPRGDSPETPAYARVANTSVRWRDLEGYYTRFGDVRELLTGVDDRYVIMNAGDELRLSFPEQPAPAAGWARDFVLIGDGWEKDGDYNTAYSKTVLPLPSHANPAYVAASESLELENDPVYQRHRQDWERFHTRYVTPDRFTRGLRRE
jgi:tetratricopeptide (TPR) repeat protein